MTGEFIKCDQCHKTSEIVKLLHKDWIYVTRGRKSSTATISHFCSEDCLKLSLGININKELKGERIENLAHKIAKELFSCNRKMQNGENVPIVADRLQFLYNSKTFGGWSQDVVKRLIEKELELFLKHN